MSRLAASSAASLANDLSHALDVAETTNAELLQRLEEAEAVIAKVREVREAWRSALGEWPGDMVDQAIRKMVRRLDGIDGL